MIVGDAVMRQMRGQSPVISDPVLDEYLQDIGNRLVVQFPNSAATHLLNVLSHFFVLELTT